MVSVAAIAFAAIFAISMLLRDIRRDQQIDMLLSQIASERSMWAKERWELNTRIQSPALVTEFPPAPPAGENIRTSVEDEEEELLDESHLIGVISG